MWESATPDEIQALFTSTRLWVLTWCLTWHLVDGRINTHPTSRLREHQPRSFLGPGSLRGAPRRRRRRRDAVDMAPRLPTQSGLFLVYLPCQPGRDPGHRVKKQGEMRRFKLMSRVSGSPEECSIEDSSAAVQALGLMGWQERTRARPIPTSSSGRQEESG